MPKMALLLATDEWQKMEVFRTFLSHAPKAIWRSQMKFKPETLAAIPFPINLYFFHESLVGYRANCVDIQRGNPTDYPLSLSPPEYRDDTRPFTTFIFIDRLDPIAETHISVFPKWRNPERRYKQGILGLLRVRDILDV
jgi:hypothetical protein